MLKTGDRGEDDIGNNDDIIKCWHIADDSGEYPKIQKQSPFNCNLTSRTDILKF